MHSVIVVFKTEKNYNNKSKCQNLDVVTSKLSHKLYSRILKHYMKYTIHLTFLKYLRILKMITV